MDAGVVGKGASARRGPALDTVRLAIGAPGSATTAPSCACNASPVSREGRFCILRVRRWAENLATGHLSPIETAQRRHAVAGQAVHDKDDAFPAQERSTFHDRPAA